MKRMHTEHARMIASPNYGTVSSRRTDLVDLAHTPLRLFGPVAYFDPVTDMHPQDK
jgi:hypothetical protein